MRLLPLTLMIIFLSNLMIDPSVAAAQSHDPRAVSMYNLGLNSFKQGSTEAAIIFFKRAADLDNNLADAHYNLGVLYQSQRRYKEAVPRFEEVLKLKPNDPEALLNLGKSYVELGQTSEAKASLQQIPPSSSHFAEAQKLVQRCDSGGGATTGSQGLKTTPLPVNEPQATQTPQYTQVTPKPRVTQIVDAQQPQSVYRPATEPVETPPTQIASASTQSTYTQPETKPSPNSSPAYSAPVAGQPTAVMAKTSVRVIATGFTSPSGLTFDRFGNLYVANYGKNTVDRISRDGTRVEFSSGGHLKGPIGLAADDAGNIYVANYLGGTVARITPAGISTVIATGFKKPYYLILDKGNNLFLSQQEDNTIIRISLPK